MRSNNRNETITNLAMPERQIPVLIDATPEKAEGYVPSSGWSEKPQTTVRRLLPSFIEGLRKPGKRREIEKEHGTISATEWHRLRELLTLIDRVNAGDWSPIITSDVEDVLDEVLTPILQLSSGGWFVDADEQKKGRLILRAASGNGDSLEIDFGLGKRFVGGPRVQNAASRVKQVTNADSSYTELQTTITAHFETAAFALSEAFTAGLSRTRFVVWWSDVGKKLVPGLYCPDIVTALYALAMWSSGTTGGWAICQRCKKDYPRSRAKQRYCSHKCQVAAAMQRLRERAKSTAPAEAKLEPKAKKRRERK